MRPDGRLYVLAGTDRHDTRLMALDSRGRRVAGFRTRTLEERPLRTLRDPRAIVAAPGGRLLVAGGGLLPQRLGRAPATATGVPTVASATAA